MSFVYKIWVSPPAYETLYAIMEEDGEKSVKATIKRLLLEADKEVIANAIRLAQRREEQRG